MEIVNHTNTVLHGENNRVSDEQFKENSAELVPIASLLVKKMDELGCSGLSACQLGINLAMFAMNPDGKERICINPQIVAATVDMETAEETCPTFPDLVLRIKRPDSVVVRYSNIDGTETVEQLDGIVARTWLHEYDHTQGICFTNRVSKLSLAMAKKRAIKMKKRIKNGF